MGDQSVGRGMLWAASLGLLLGLTLLFSGLDRSDGTAVSGLDGSGRATLTIEAGRGGHYLADGTVNGSQVRFLVDTGATDVALSESLARELGLEFGPRVTVMTAAGPAPAWMTRLDSVSLGGLERRNVRATITPGLGEEALLGMSFLKHFSIRQEGGNLIIASTGSAGT